MLFFVVIVYSLILSVPGHIFTIPLLFAAIHITETISPDGKLTILNYSMLFLYYYCL